MVKVKCKVCGKIGYTASPNYSLCKCGGKLKRVLFENLPGICYILFVIKKPILALVFCLAFLPSVFSYSDEELFIYTATTYIPAIISPTGFSPSRRESAPNLIDNNDLTFFAVDLTKRPYLVLTFDLGTPTYLSRMKIFWHRSYGSSNYSIQGSNDGLRWVALLKGLSTAGSPGNPLVKEHILPEAPQYRYVRLFISKAQESNLIVLFEVKLYGYVNPLDKQTKIPPKILSINPKDSSTFYEGDSVIVTPGLQGNIPDLGLLVYQFSFDGLIKQPWQGQAAYSLTNLPAGIHKLKVEARNRLGEDAKEVVICVFKRPISPP